jgi:hypothetical protein
MLGSLIGKKLGVPVIILLVLLALAGLGAWRSDLVRFVPISGGDVVDLLTPLILIALFIERALEVFVTGWRSLDKDKLEKGVEVARQTSGDVATAEATLDEYRRQTQRIAFLSAAAAGAFIALCGVRVLEPLTDIQLAQELWRDNPGGIGLQGFGFRLADIVLTAGLLAGGAEGIHRVMTLFLDFVSTTREKITATAPVAPPVTPP